MELNILISSGLLFPYGLATTKRRRYMVDYMNVQGVECHVLVLRHQVKSQNPLKGMYGDCDYIDISYLLNEGKIFQYYHQGKIFLKKWFNSDKKNVVVCDTKVEFWDYPIIRYAYSLGYKIVYDQVETDYNTKGTNNSIKTKIHFLLTGKVSRRAYKWSDGSFVISEALKEQNLKAYPPQKMCILPNSTPILEKTKKQFFSNPPTILYSGTFAKKDGVEYLLKAFLLVQKKGYSCRLIMTGKGQPSDMKVLELVKDNPDVQYKGMVSDRELVETLLDCDILTMTRENSKFSNYGFPFKLSESLATGNPVIATNVSDVGKYVKHMESVYLVQPECVEEIANGIIYYLENPQNALQIGQNGLNVMKKHFSIEGVGKKFIDFLVNI